MDRVVTFLAGISLIALLIGLFRPRWVLPAKLNPSRLRVGLVYGAAVILFGSLAPQPDPAVVGAQEAVLAPLPLSAETRPTANPTQDPAPIPASLRAKRDILIKTAEDWGWRCKAPEPMQSLVALAGQHARVPSESVFCAPKQSLSDPNFILDHLKIEGTAEATYLIIYDWDLTTAPPTAEATTTSRIAQITRLIGGATAEKDAHAAIEKQRDLKREQACKNFTDCPGYDEQAADGGVAVRIMAKPKTRWNWAFSPAELAAIK